MQSIAKRTDDLENREISAAEIHRLPLNRRMQAEQVSDLKEHFDCDYRTIISGSARAEAGRSRRSEVSEGLQIC
jgi:hypothetical protein